ncbi:MAG TPA: hypothetical protein VIH99_12865 [Bdellovibrionota bacterium]|jgi:anti-anti-sigma regulatory factor
MKLALRQEESCSVLEVQGNIDIHNFTVMKAGLSKLFQNGKNKIVVHIVDGKELSPEVIRELAILDVFARELSGKIVLASASEDLKSKVTSFAKPPVVAILPSVAKAVEYLKDVAKMEGEVSGEAPAESSPATEAKDKEIAALQAQLKMADPSEANKLRQENAELKDKLGLLEGQLAEILGKKKQPVDASGFMEKIEALEESVRKMSGEKAVGKK